jgi:hypothetical protein
MSCERGTAEHMGGSPTAADQKRKVPVASGRGAIGACSQGRGTVAPDECAGAPNDPFGV